MWQVAELEAQDKLLAQRYQQVRDRTGPALPSINYGSSQKCDIKMVGGP